MEEDYGIDVEAARSAGNKYFEFLDEYEKKEQADGAIQQEQAARENMVLSSKSTIDQQLNEFDLLDQAASVARQGINTDPLV